MTLYFLHLSGKGEEIGRGLLLLEINQGSGILRTCLASQMERLQHRRKLFSAEIYTCQSVSPGPRMAELGHAIHEQEERKKEAGRDFRALGLWLISGRETGPAFPRPTWLHLAPSLTYSVL